MSDTAPGSAAALRTPRPSPSSWRQGLRIGARGAQVSSRHRFPLARHRHRRVGRARSGGRAAVELRVGRAGSGEGDARFPVSAVGGLDRSAHAVGGRHRRCRTHPASLGHRPRRGTRRWHRTGIWNGHIPAGRGIMAGRGRGAVVGFGSRSASCVAARLVRGRRGHCGAAPQPSVPSLGAMAAGVRCVLVRDPREHHPGRRADGAVRGLRRRRDHTPRLRVQRRAPEPRRGGRRAPGTRRRGSPVAGGRPAVGRGLHRPRRRWTRGWPHRQGVRTRCERLADAGACLAGALVPQGRGHHAHPAPAGGARGVHDAARQERRGRGARDRHRRSDGRRRRAARAQGRGGAAEHLGAERHRRRHHRPDMGDDRSTAHRRHRPRRPRAVDDRPSGRSDGPGHEPRRRGGRAHPRSTSGRPRPDDRGQRRARRSRHARSRTR